MMLEMLEIRRKYAMLENSTNLVMEFKNQLN